MLLYLAGYRTWQWVNTTLGDDPTRGRRSSTWDTEHLSGMDAIALGQCSISSRNRQISSKWLAVIPTDDEGRIRSVGASRPRAHSYASRNNSPSIQTSGRSPTADRTASSFQVSPVRSPLNLTTGSSGNPRRGPIDCLLSLPMWSPTSVQRTERVPPAIRDACLRGRPRTRRSTGRRIRAAVEAQAGSARHRRRAVAAAARSRCAVHHSWQKPTKPLRDHGVPAT